jgi:hypothetical protein
MAKRKYAEVKPSSLVTESFIDIDGFTINSGDIIKVHGQHGSKFKFIGATTNTRTGSFWIDCFEIIRGVPSVFRSFKLEKIKRIPQRGKRAKRVI